MFYSFNTIIGCILNGQDFPTSEKIWTRKPFSRKEFNQLSKITVDMSAEEIGRRVRATTFGVWKPTVEIGGFVFELKSRI